MRAVCYVFNYVCVQSHTHTHATTLGWLVVASIMWIIAYVVVVSVCGIALYYAFTLAIHTHTLTPSPLLLPPSPRPSLQYAQTENGKCRAWVRLAVNECSLESYIHVLCQDGSLLGQYYEPHGFLRDDESVSTLTQLLVGVAEVTFDL